MQIKRLTIIGVGLIGGSLARALKKSHAVDEIVGASRREEHLKEAVKLGVIDRYETDYLKAVADADVVLLAVPLGCIRDVLANIKPALKAKTIVTDAGSAKGSVVDDVRSVFGDVPENFVPAHPIAGNEKSGVSASIEGLFHGRRVIVTPLPTTSQNAVDQVSWMWRQTGAHVISMTVEHHDQVLAATSHLPHMLAFGLVDALAKMDDRQEIFQYAAGGFRDFTRIASSDPTMWRDICLANRKALHEALDFFLEDIKGLKQAVNDGDGEKLLDLFSRAKAARDNFIKFFEG